VTLSGLKRLAEYSGADHLPALVDAAIGPELHVVRLGGVAKGYLLRFRGISTTTAPVVEKFNTSSLTFTIMLFFFFLIYIVV
jgi:hypothetical protein